ncbi:MAG: PAS domain S-box protein [Ignavibacteriae bacterium]|nr:MAG: PAS domain S-box protein [Ignavibacteriota bacterium]
MWNKIKLSLDYKVLFWFLLAFITILVLGYEIIKANDENLSEYSFRQKSFTNIISILNLEHYLEDAEAAQLGYLITGNVEFLKEYDLAIKDAYSILNEIKNNFSGKGNNNYIIYIDSLMKVKISNMNIFIKNRTEPNHEKNLLLIASDSNMMLMKNIKNILNKMNELENNRLKLHTDAAAYTANYTKTILPAGLAFALLFITLGYLLIRRDMIARQKAEEELDKIFKLSPDLICVIDSAGKFVRANPAWEKTLGYPVNELISRPYVELVHPDDVERSREVSKDIRKGKTGYLFENRFRTKKGNYRWLQWSTTANVETGLGYSIAKDITNVKEKEIELRKLNEQLIKSFEETERIFSLSLDMLSIVGIDGFFKKLNPAWEKNLGYTIDELMSKPYLEFVHPDDIEHTTQAANKLAAGEDVFIENRYLAKNGKYRWLQWTAASIPEIGLIYATAKDITNIKEKEIEVKKLNERLLNSYAETERIFMLSANLMSITNMEGEFVKLNPAWENLLGYSIEELLSIKYIDLVHPDDVESSKNASRIVRKGNDISSFENRFRTKNGSYKWLRWYATIVRDEGLVYATASDVTDSKEKEHELTTLNERLYESYKEMESFSYSVSHDLRAPLRHIIGFSQKLKKLAYGDISEESKKSLDKIVASAEHMSKLIDDLLHFSRVGRSDLKMIAIDMNRFIVAVKQDLEISEERNIEWQISNLPEVNADPVYLSLAINNLLSNAVKYTSKNQQTVIQVTCKEEEFEFIFCIKDNGVGFDSKYTDKLFGVFQRLHPSYEFEGTGIGLAIASKVFQKHGGRIWAESEIGKGAAFYFSLPKI